MDVIETIGPRIAFLRKAKGFSQKDCAELLGVTQASFSRVEMGSTKPSLPFLVALAEKLEITLDELVFGGETPITPSERPGRFVGPIIRKKSRSSPGVYFERTES